MYRPLITVEEVRFHPLNSRKTLEYLEFQTGFKKQDEDLPPGESYLDPGKAIRSSDIDLVGSFYAMGITGITWFSVVNIWNCLGGFDGGWRQMIANYTNIKGGAFLSDIEDLRWNADCRPLLAAPGSPLFTDLRDEGYKVPIFVYEVAQARPGAALDYLAAVGEEKAPVLAEHGHRLLGLYESFSVDDQVVTFWGTDLDGHLELNHARDAALGLDDTVQPDPRLLEWRRRSGEFLVPGLRRECMMMPYQGTRHSPVSD
jgi:hypothetical protein